MLERLQNALLILHKARMAVPDDGSYVGSVRHSRILSGKREERLLCWSLPT